MELIEHTIFVNGEPIARCDRCGSTRIVVDDARWGRRCESCHTQDVNEHYAPDPVRHNASHQRLRDDAPALPGDHYADECGDAR